MKIFCAVLFWLGTFVIIWAMMGYRLSLKILAKFFENKKLIKDYARHPRVTVMVVAHNEEKVIRKKLENIIQNDYPKEKIDYIVASDCSTDKTNEIIADFIREHPEQKIQLYKSKEHKGKTNAQNEAQKKICGEVLVMTDANSLFERNSISELVSCFTSDDIAYVAGHLIYNNTDNITADLESLYWKGDLMQREIESNIKTITAGNGAIYACLNRLYYDFEPRKCHDGNMPTYYAKRGMRALYNPKAIAYEKAGEIIGDEFKRKIRMNRNILPGIVEGISCLNIFKYGWFSYFQFGHRFCRQLLWISHFVVLVMSAILMNTSYFYAALFLLQMIFYLVAVVNLKLKCQHKWLLLVGYYVMTIFAQWIGVFNCVAGRSKATWDKAESTR